jgi:hypothetical protein
MHEQEPGRWMDRLAKQARIAGDTGHRMVESQPALEHRPVRLWRFERLRVDTGRERIAAADPNDAEEKE